MRGRRGLYSPFKKSRHSRALRASAAWVAQGVVEAASDALIDPGVDVLRCGQVEQGLQSVSPSGARDLLDGSLRLSFNRPMRSLMLGLSAALLANGTVLAQGASDPWFAGYELQGWTFLGANDGQAYYFRRGRKLPDGNPTMWSRSEWRQQPAPDVLSTVTLDEYDCGQGRYRSLQQTAYAEHNLSGASDNRTIAPGWKFTIPNTFGDEALQVACSGSTKPAR
jgi:hypothetical protein